MLILLRLNDTFLSLMAARTCGEDATENLIESSA